MLRAQRSAVDHTVLINICIMRHVSHDGDDDDDDQSSLLSLNQLLILQMLVPAGVVCVSDVAQSSTMTSRIHVT